MIRHCRIFVSIAILSSASASAQSTFRVSVDSNGAQGNNYSGTYGAAISADGRFVAFGSGATNLVPGGSPLQWEIFRHDRLTGVTSLVNVDSFGNLNSGTSLYPSISADGSCVAFEGNGGISVHDFTSGLTTSMSLNSNGNSFHSPAISGDARYVAFHRLHPTTIYHNRTDVYVHDRQSGVTSVVNVNTAGVQTSGLYSSDPSISFDGRLIAFASSASDLVAGDTNARYDIFVRDMQAGSTTRASVDSLGGEGNGDSLDPSISSNGRFVAFSSVATNLAPSDVNGHADVFVHDSQTGATVLASVGSTGIQANADCLNPSLSGDGRFVTFKSVATNLVVGDTNNQMDVFVRDLLLGTTQLVSVGLATAANGASDRAAISADGRNISFVSFAGNLVTGDTNGTFDVFVRDQGCTFESYAYCTAKVNSVGCSPTIAMTGAASASAGSGCFVTAAQVLNNKPGLLLYGTNGQQAAPFQGGVLCVEPPIKRASTQGSGGNPPPNDCSGSYSFDFNVLIAGGVDPQLVAGAIVDAQYWARDPGFTAPNNTSLTNGIQFLICP